MHVIQDIAEGLTYLHQNKIVHQDIKPANILVDTRGDKPIYVLSDFGISSKTKTRLSHSVNINSKNQGTSMTEAYAPPENSVQNEKIVNQTEKGIFFLLEYLYTN